MLCTQIAISSLKWKYIILTEKVIVPYLYLFKTYLIGSFVSLFLPSSFGGDIYRIYALKKYNLDVLQNTSSVFFDRLTGLFALLSLSVISHIMFYGNKINYVLLTLYLLSIFLFWIISSDSMVSFLAKFQNKIVQFGWRLIRSFNKFRSDKKLLVSSLLLSFLFQNNMKVISYI